MAEFLLYAPQPLNFPVVLDQVLSVSIAPTKFILNIEKCTKQTKLARQPSSKNRYFPISKDRTPHKIFKEFRNKEEMSSKNKLGLAD